MRALVEGRGVKAFAVRFVACVVLVAACGKGGSSGPPAAYRFLPANPEVVVRLDLPRVRAWPHYEKVAAKALAGVDGVLAATKQQCGLDVIGEASSVILAKRGPLLAGDLTVIASGLAKDKVAGCLAKILAANTPVKLQLEDNLVQARIGDRPIASGAILPTGEVVLVARNGAGIEPAAWKTEVAQGAVAIPAWVAELDAEAPIAVRTSDETRTVIAKVTLGDPLVIGGRVISPNAEAAKRDEANLRAIASYLQNGDAGVARVEPVGTTTHADLTARGKQIDNLLAIAVPALFPAPAPVDATTAAPADPNAPPPDCSKLGPAVKAYLDQNLATSPPSRRAELEAQMAKLVPALQEAFIAQCTADRWAAAAIECHVTNATALARFERCRQTLPDDQRERLDKAVAAALTAAK